MRGVQLVAGLTISLAAFAQPAAAAPTEKFDWSLASPDFEGFDKSPVVGSGTITATEGSGGAWTVDAITGSFTDLALDGQPTFAVTGIGAIAGNILGVTNDNEIYPAGPLFLDTSGLSFETTTGPIDLYWSPPDNAYQEVSHLGIGTGNFSLKAVPLPPALPMFGAGLGLVGLLCRRQKHKTQGTGAKA